MNLPETIALIRRDLYSVRHWLHQVKRSAPPNEGWQADVVVSALRALDDLETEVAALDRRGRGA